MARQALALLATLAVVLGACEYPGVPHPLAATGPTDGRAWPAPAPGVALPSGPGAGQPSKTGATDSQMPQALPGTVRVTQKDFRLDPDNVTAKAGTITFVLQNEGRYTHDFRVEGQGVDEKGPKVGSGRSLEWRLTLRPGTYRISCPVSNHADRGMVGTLAVVQ